MGKKRFIFWLLLIVFFGVFFIKEQFMLHNLNDVNRQYKDQLNKLNLQNKQLQNEKLTTRRKDYIENQAREKLGLVKPGEILFIDKSKKGE